jgi:hypothetical protein
MLEVGKHGQRHDDTSKEVTAPTGVVVSFMDFSMALLSTPKPVERTPKSQPL